MNENEKAAVIMGRSAEALIRALGMMSENLQQVREGGAIAYTSEDFERVIHDCGIYWNAIATVLKD